MGLYEGWEYGGRLFLFLKRIGHCNQAKLKDSYETG